MRGLTVIAKSELTLQTIINQLNGLVGDKINIKGYYLDGNMEENIEDDLVLISSQGIFNKVIKYLSVNCPYIIARRSINYHEIYKIIDLEEGSEVLLVNDLESTTTEAIALLKTLGLDYISYYPYYPGIKKYPKLKTAITIGEPELIPQCINEYINIGTRIIDYTTLVEVLGKLDLLDEKANILSARYLRDIIDLTKETRRMMKINNRINTQFKTIINSVHDGIVAFDKDNRITVYNPIAEKIFRIPEEMALENDLGAIDPIVKHLKILDDKLSEGEELIKINGKNIIAKKYMTKGDNINKEKIYTLKDVTEIQRLEEELRRKLVSCEYTTSYNFESIQGKSKTIKYAKNLAKRIAKSDSPILIEGESGTGKELFAHAIHNASNRKNGPFVAINFAALPDSLIESELFGYEEGAFTGARKGGMKGLFEQAHGGTIFLDEIGDAPISFQIRLLRVIQEKQVRRIGGTKVIPIDVRILSATNKNLKDLIASGDFREDLYYRIKVLPLEVPPLRERKLDIMVLAKTFYNDYFDNKPITIASEYFSLIQDHLEAYSWPGNIRELHNIVEYLVCSCDNNIPTPDNLPNELSESKIDNKWESIQYQILYEIYNANKNNKSIGRRSLSRKLSLPENQIRERIMDLEAQKLIKINRGAKGLTLLDRGFNTISH